MKLELLALLVATLLVGPAVTQLARRYTRAEALINLTALILIGTLTLLFIVPEAYVHGGWLTLVFVFAGFLLPLILHRIGRMNFGADSVLVAGVLIHVLIESAAVAIAPDPEHLGIAVAAHRVPVGLAVFMLAPNSRGGWAIILLLAAVTCIGFFGGQWMPHWLNHTQEAWLEGFVAGSLFHIIHGHSKRDNHVH
ncbi:MAG: hypothetical protein AAF438_09350 [Pseudomonadota bacterium]